MSDLATDTLITRQRLLEAAGEVFADKGFRGATIRHICKRAGANVAAVKYHFGGKERLYSEAVRYAHLCSVGTVTEATMPPADASPRERIRAFARIMLGGLLASGRPAWHSKLMAREIAEPTAVLKQLADEGVKPRLKILSEIVRSVIGPDAPQVQVHRAARSIVGQILFYHFARPMLDRVFPHERIDASIVDELAEHVTMFSVGGLEELARQRRDERASS